MPSLLSRVFSPYRPLLRAYLAAVEDDPVRAKWVYEFAPLAALSVVATILFFADLSLFWTFLFWVPYVPLWVFINYGQR